MAELARVNVTLESTCFEFAKSSRRVGRIVGRTDASISVPPFATARMPDIVIVPDAVTGPPDVVRPVVPPDTSIDVTVTSRVLYSRAVPPLLTAKT